MEVMECDKAFGDKAFHKQKPTPEDSPWGWVSSYPKRFKARIFGWCTGG